MFVFEDQLPEDPSSPAPTPSPSSAVSRLRCADWLLRDTPYSEGVAEHKRGETCRDCVRFHGDESSELQVSVHGASIRTDCSGTRRLPTGLSWYVCAVCPRLSVTRSHLYRRPVVTRPHTPRLHRSHRTLHLPAGSGSPKQTQPAAAPQDSGCVSF